MEKTIKYLENGEYHYATVRDVGDLAKLKTDSKDDLVTAINELYLTGGGGSGGKPEGYDNLVNNVADAIQKQQQMASSITNMEQNAQLSDAEMAHMKQVQEELHQEYIKALKELNEAVEKAKADAADLAKKTDEMQDKIDETFANVDKEVSDVHKQLDSESASLRKDLDDTKTSLESTRKDLLNNTQEFGVVNSEVKELKDKMDRRIWSTDLDPVREQVSKNTTEVSQTKDELKNKADQSSLDLVTNSVENLSTQVKQNASGLEVAVKRDELGGDVSRLLNDKTNLLLGTRNFAGEDNWKNRDTVTIEPGYYKGLKSAAVQVTDASIYQPYHIKADTAYTFSFFAREDKDNPKAKLAIKPINAKNINIDNEEQVVHITTEWQRFAVTFSADKECDVSIQVIQGPEASNNVLHLAGLKLQYGQNNTPWEPNEADVAENIEKNESRFNVFSDQITGLVKKQEKMGDTERQLDTRITETAEGLKQTSKDLEDANGKITEFKGQLESTAKGIKTDYEKYTNEAVGQISDSSLNLIHNSAFSNQDNQFESWQNISAKATVREDSNNLHWVELTQTGQSTDNPIGLASNYFMVKQGKVTVAVDVKLGNKANLDNQNILLLELYNDSKKRVDFTDVSVSQLGLSTGILGDHNVHRGMYRLGIDRKDVKYMTVKAILHRNGDLWLTNFSARLSSIDDGGYTPNPDDMNHQILKMNTKIEEDAEHIALKANSVDVTRDIKSAVDGIDISGVNLLRNTDPKQIDGVESSSTWILGSAGNGSAKVIDLPDSNIFTAKHGFEIYGNTTGNRDFTQRPIHWTNNKYVFSIYVRIADVSQVKAIDMLTRAWSNQTNKAVFENHHTITSKEWTRVTMSIDASSFYSQSGVSMAFGLAGIGSMDFAQPMLELANKASKWSPNPQDTSAEIKSAKEAAIKVASDQIDLHVNELSTSFNDRINQRLNEAKSASEKFTSDGIEQTVKKITDVKNDVDAVSNKLNNLRVGGRNLLHGTSDQWRTLQGNTWLQKTTASTCWTSTADYHSGNTFTYAAKITNNSHQQAELEIWLCDTNKNLINGQTFHAPIPQGANAYDVSVTFPITVDTWYIRSWVIFTGGHAPNGDSVQVKEERLVEGNLAGAWTPNPDDVNQKIDSVKTETTASVKNLGDRVTTEVNSITTKFNGLQSDDRNLAVGTKHDWQTKTGFNGGTNNCVDIADYIDLSELQVGDVLQMGITVKKQSGDSGNAHWFVQGCGDKTGWGSGMYGGPHYYNKDLNNGQVYKREWSFKIATDPAKNNRWQPVQLRFDNVPAGTAFYWKDFYVKKGNVKTGWTPAPEDTADKIKELNTKWDVANGEIQGKVTETQVNNILNGKGYATQAWAQSNFRMKSDSIDLEVRKITDPISSKLNSVNEKDGINLLTGTADFSGSWFRRDDGSWTDDNWRDNLNNRVRKRSGSAWNGLGQTVYLEPGNYTFSLDMYLNLGNNDSLNFYAGDTQYNGTANIVQILDGNHYDHNSPQARWFRAACHFKVTKAGNVAIRPELNQSRGTVHVGSYKLEKGLIATPWTPSPKDLPTNSNIISKINVSPEKIRLLSSKIEIDGNTYIHGTLNVPNVVLKGNSGQVDLTGSGLNISGNGNNVALLTDGLHLSSKDNSILFKTDGIDITGKNNQIVLNGSGINIAGHGRKILIDNQGVNIGGQNTNLFLGDKAVVFKNAKNYFEIADDSFLIISESMNNKYKFGTDGHSQLNITGSSIEFGSSTGTGYKQLGIITPTTYQKTSVSGMSFIVEGVNADKQNWKTYPDDRAHFFSLARETAKQEGYYHGMVYKANPSGPLDLGFHFFDPIYLHPYGAEGGIRTTWCSWSSMGNKKYPVLVNDGHNWGGIAFPQGGSTFVFDSSGHIMRPGQGVGNYSGYGEGNKSYFDPVVWN